MSCRTFWWHIIDVWHVPTLHYACKVLSDLGNGPNKPTVTIIGEYTCHGGALRSEPVFLVIRHQRGGTVSVSCNSLEWDEDKAMQSRWINR